MRRFVVVVAVAMVAGLVALFLVERSGSKSAPAGADARSFVDAWRRSLTGTWTVQGTSVRAGLTNPITIIQRPPDRLERQGKAVTGMLGGRRVSCVVDPTGAVRCHDGGASPPYASSTTQQTSDLTSEVGGPAPVYLVTRDGSACFRLRLAYVVAAPPYGQSAHFCFDAATGAPTLQESELNGVVDQREFTAVRPSVDGVDLQLPAALER